MFYKRLLQAPITLGESFFLFGPRGTGKTMWVKTEFPNGLYLDLLDSSLFRDLQASPRLLEKLIPRNFSDWVIIDEVQRIPELLHEVHRLIETYHYKFILTGSSARSLRKKGVYLLGGRAHAFSMHPLTSYELGADFSVEKALLSGLLPATFSTKDPLQYLHTYITTYLTEEVRYEGLTRDLSNFTRFLQVASFSQGQLLNISTIAQEAAVNRKVVESYFHILEDLLLAYRIPIFSKRAARALTAHPKFYFFDVGVFRTLRPKGIYDRGEEVDGPVLETLFLQELVALNDYLQLGYTISYWRTTSQVEVDFVLYGPKGFFAFEIKRARSANFKDIRPLKTFGTDYPEAKLFLAYGGERREYHDSIQVVPFEELLKELPRILKG